MLCFVHHSASVDKHSASGLDQIVPSTAEQQRYLPLLPEKRVLTASDWLRAPQLSNVVAGECTPASMVVLPCSMVLLHSRGDLPQYHVC